MHTHGRHRTIKQLLIHISNMLSTVADTVKLIHELFVWFSPTKFPYYCVESNWFAQSGKTCVWLKSKTKRKTNFDYAKKSNFCVFMGHVPTRWKRKTVAYILISVFHSHWFLCKCVGETVNLMIQGVKNFNTTYFKHLVFVWSDSIRINIRRYKLDTNWDMWNRWCFEMW